MSILFCEPCQKKNDITPVVDVVWGHCEICGQYGAIYKAPDDWITPLELEAMKSGRPPAPENPRAAADDLSSEASRNRTQGAVHGFFAGEMKKGQGK